MDIHVLWISVFNYLCFYGYPFGYPLISVDIHALTCYGFSIQGFSNRIFIYFHLKSRIHTRSDKTTDYLIDHRAAGKSVKFYWKPVEFH